MSTNNIARGLIRGSQIRFQSTESTFSIHSPCGIIHRPSSTSPEMFSLGRFSRPPRPHAHLWPLPARPRVSAPAPAALILDVRMLPSVDPCISSQAPHLLLRGNALLGCARSPASPLPSLRPRARALALRLLRPQRLRARRHRRIVQRLGLIQVRLDLHPRVCAPRAPLPACVPNHLRPPLGRSAAVDQDRPRALPPSLP
jgi:hypothetical protein